jgi:hypothetical protein
MTQTTYYIAAAVVALLAIAVGGWVGAPKGRQGLGMLLGFLLSWVGVLIVAMTKGDPSTDPEDRSDARMRGVVGVILGIVGIAAIAGMFALSSRVQEPMSGVVARMTGASNVECELEGWIMVGGAREDLYGCADRFRGGSLGCFVKLEKYVQDVTQEAKSIGDAGGDKLPCANT